MPMNNENYHSEYFHHLHAQFYMLFLTIMHGFSPHLFSACKVKKAELIFVLDSSSSVSEADFLNYVLGSVEMITMNFGNQKGIRVSIVYYSSYSFVAFKLQRLTKKMLLKKIKKVSLLRHDLSFVSI